MKKKRKKQASNIKIIQTCQFLFYIIKFHFFLQSPKRSKSDSSDWEKKVKYHGKRRNALVPALVRKKKLVHDFCRFNNTPYATFSVRKNKKRKQRDN